MIIEKDKKTIVQSHDFDSVNCTIDAEDMRYVASLLRNNYSNTRLAVVREISANALDANVEANETRPIEISIPSKLSPTFRVRDFGGGLSKEDVFGLYSKYGKSTKRQSNNYIGAFGIGKFAPLSYGDNFTCVSYNGGLKSSYNVFVNDNDDTKIVELQEPEPSNEPSGLCIEVAVSESDVDDFRKIIKNFFEFFSDKEMPKFIGDDGTFIRNRSKVIESKNGSWFFLEDERNDSYYSQRSYNAHIIMGRVAYPLDKNSVQVDNFVESSRKKDIIYNLLGQTNFYLRLPLGAVKLHHSRESLEYNKATQQKIIGAMLKACDEVQEIAKEKLADSNDLFEAKSNYARIVNSMPYNMRQIFENAFEWNGIKIQSATFHREHKMYEDLILTQTTRESDSSARNGFKVRSQKVSRIHCDDETIFLMQDIESSHGNNLRARTIFNENDKLNTIFFINPLTKLAKSYIKNEWNFNLVDKKHIRLTSNVVKEKIQYNGVRKSNGSRANIPLFEMVQERPSYRNIDYWKNVKEDIDKIQDDTDGAIDGKLVYVKIKNYKIDSDDYDLGKVYSLCDRVRKRSDDKSDAKKFRLFGIRSGDVSKLDSDSWISFEDFLLQNSKDYLLSNLTEAKKSYIKFSVDSLNHDNADIQKSIADCRYNLAYIMNATRIKFDKLPKDNLIRKIRSDFQIIINDGACPQCSSAIAFISKFDKDWLKFNLDNGFSAKQFAKDIDAIREKYSFLDYVSNSVNSYRADEKLFKDIIDYILLCDKN
jgi:hypothetical protein